MILSENRLIFKDLENHIYYLNVNELFHVSKLFLKFIFCRLKQWNREKMRKCREKAKGRNNESLDTTCDSVLHESNSKFPSK